MRSIKAIIAGSVFILVVLMLLGLIYIFIAVGYNALAADFPFLNDITGLFRYLVAIPLFMVTIFTGGYITASIANTHDKIKVWLHCLTVGLITVGGTLAFAMSYSNLTLTGVVVIILALSASSAGGLYWLRGNNNNE
ncbi:MAG: hypothetical protein OEY36_06650 [Gammaproteobacteria bacterium]|nr:hypothetical protein [Gammaproteobacteria bacterium]